MWLGATTLSVLCCGLEFSPSVLSGHAASLFTLRGQAVSPRGRSMARLCRREMKAGLGSQDPNSALRVRGSLFRAALHHMGNWSRAGLDVQIMNYRHCGFYHKNVKADNITQIILQTILSAIQLCVNLSTKPGALFLGLEPSTPKNNNNKIKHILLFLHQNF